MEKEGKKPRGEGKEQERNQSKSGREEENQVCGIHSPLLEEDRNTCVHACVVKANKLMMN